MNNMIFQAGLLGGYEILVVVLIVVLLFGGKKIPELMRGLGKGVREFKDSTNTDNLKEEVDKISSEFKDIHNEIKKNTEPVTKTKSFLNKNLKNTKKL